MNQPATDTLRLRERGEGVRSLQRRGATWVALDPIPGVACGADISLRQWPGLGLQWGTVWGNRHEHTRGGSFDGSDDLSLHINLKGVSIVSGRSSEITLRDGDAVLLSYAEARTIARPRRVDHRIVRFPRASLAPLVRNIDDLVLRAVPRGAGALGLLTNYLGALADEPMIGAADMRQLVVAQLCDLVAVTLGAMRDVEAAAEGRGLWAARLRAVKSDIEAHLGSCHLSPALVAKRQGISERYVRKLFEADGGSFSEFVLSRRLVRARRLLSDCRWAARTIASIAFECGFGDLSYFNRTFKQFYGAPPSDLRRKADDT
jgi:AraC-like DNA-binding protein